jgi:hypothetical protein
MICWADITLPSSRVRSDALRTNLLNSALLGRRVIGTVSGSLGLGFLAFERAGAAAATGSLAAGVEDANTGADTGAGAELRPAGWLAAAEIRAAKSLESRFFFMLMTLGVMVRLCGITIPRLHNIATPCSHECAALRHFAVTPLQ